MSDLLIRNVPPALKGEIRKRAQEHGRSLSEEAKILLQKSLSAVADRKEDFKENAYDILRRSFSDAQLTDEQAVVLEEAIDERRKDFGRDVELPE